jgi:hypothetical protein
MTYAQAINIQRAHLYWYRSKIGRKGVKQIRQRTLPCPADIHPDQQISVIDINKMVPRGGSIENLARPGAPWNPDNSDVQLALSDALKAGRMI